MHIAERFCCSLISYDLWKLFLCVLFNPGEPYITSLRNWVTHVISCRQTFAERGYDPKGNANSNQHKCPFCQKIWNKLLES